jgi:release factor glutamine methyltransferase
VVATDISAPALEVAEANARRQAVQIELRRGDLLEPALDLVNVAAVVANPPYVEGVEADGLQEGVRRYEPHVALFVPDGGVTDLYERLARQALTILEPGGLVAVEHGSGQRELVCRAFRAAGLVDVEGRDDLAGIDRVVVGYRTKGDP